MPKRVTVPDEDHNHYNESEYYSEEEKEYQQKQQEYREWLKNPKKLQEKLLPMQFELMETQQWDDLIQICKMIEELNLEETALLYDHQDQINLLIKQIIQAQRETLAELEHNRLRCFASFLECLNKIKFFSPRGPEYQDIQEEITG